MVINDSKKFIFVHIPKTAGSSIAQAVGGKTGMFVCTNKQQKQVIFASHTYANEAKKFLGPATYNSYFSFAFVRNPWSRLYSLYTFMCNKPQIEKEKQIYDQELFKQKGFKWFLLEHKLHSQRVKVFGTNLFTCAQTTPQTNWVCDDNGNLIVKYIGKYENLEHDFTFVKQAVGAQITLPWINKHSNNDYKNAYDNEMVEFVEHHHKKDIEMFNYQFE